MKTLTKDEALNILSSFSPDILTTDKQTREIAISAFLIGYYQAQKDTAVPPDLPTNMTGNDSQ